MNFLMRKIEKRMINCSENALVENINKTLTTANWTTSRYALYSRETSQGNLLADLTHTCKVKFHDANVYVSYTRCVRAFMVRSSTISSHAKLQRFYLYVIWSISLKRCLNKWLWFKITIVLKMLWWNVFFLLSCLSIIWFAVFN